MVSGRTPWKNYEEEARLIEEWSKKPDTLWLQEFALERDVEPQTLYTWRDSSPIFAEALKKARARISIKMKKKLHDKENPLNYGLYQREITCHDLLLYQFEKEEKEFEASLKNKQEISHQHYYYDRDPTERKGNSNSSQIHVSKLPGSSVECPEGQ